MHNNDSDIRFVGFNKYTRLPIKENTNKNWVMNGKNNENYKYIIDRYNGSTTNKAINNSYIDLAYGRGISIHDQEEDSKELEEFLSIMSKKDIKAVISDYQILGELSMQIHRQSGSKNKLAKIEHISKSNVIPSIEDENGIIRSYWYSADWSKQFQNKYKPKEYPAFGYAEDFNFELPEIYVGKPYQIGQEYFATPDYDACLQYAEVEEEISNYYISHIKNGLSFGSVINVPDAGMWNDEQRDAYIKDVKGRLSGSSGAGRIAFNFMRGSEAKPTTITNVENNSAHKQWDFLTKEASNKILSGHKCMSPALVGLSSSTGFSSVADEMDMMEQQLMKRVIAPKQDFTIDSIDEVLDFFGLSYDLYFRPLTEIEGEKEEKEKVNDKEVVKDNEIELSKKKSDFELFLESGEDEDLETYDILDENELDYEENLQFVSTGVARPNAKSSQDGEDFVVRYRYVGNKTPERSFCKAMMNANKVYRKEDILQLTNKPVNKGFGMDGADTYSIWLYKGGGLLSDAFPGGTCKHKWNRVIYLKKGKKLDVNSPLAKTISTSAARRKGLKIETNESIVSVAPHSIR